MASGIIVGGKVYPVVNPITRHPIPVFAWCDPIGMHVPEFKAGDGHNKPRKDPIDLCVIHWTGGEAEPDRMAETLRKRKLGVEFAISRIGCVFQFCDPTVVDTADAGVVNHRSIGIEVVCYGYAASIFSPLRAMRVPVVPKLGRDRQTYFAHTHGRRVKTARFYPHQVTALCALADALTDAIPGLPRVVSGSTSVNESILDGSFGGFCGHCQVSKRKRDPGPLPLGQLSNYFTDGVIT